MDTLFTITFYLLYPINKQAKLKVAPESVKRFKEKVRQAVRQGRGRNMQRFILEDLNPQLRAGLIIFDTAKQRAYSKNLTGGFDISCAILFGVNGSVLERGSRN